MRFASTRARRAALAAALATAVVAAVAGTAAATARPTGSQIELGAGHAGTAAQVPWTTVGPGWELVQYDSTTNTVGHIKPGALTLFLVDPAGGRYRMYRWPAIAAVPPMLTGWSGNGSEALFTVGTNDVQQLNLRTGKMTTIRLRGIAFTAYASYARPADSRALIALGPGSRLSVFSSAGTMLRNLGVNSAGAIQSSDGSQFVLPESTGLRLVTSTGRLVRNLPVRAAGCRPVRYWNSVTVLASCAVTQDNPQDRLWLVPTSGRAPRALTSARLTAPDLVNLGAWQLPTGLYLQAEGGCGSLYVMRQQRDGGTTVVNVPGTSGARNQIVTASGSRLLLESGTGCEPADSLLWFNPATHAEQWLIRAPSNIYGVMSVIPFYSRADQPTF